MDARATGASPDEGDLSMDDHPVGRPNLALRALRFLIAGILLPAAVLYGGYRVADHLMATSPRARSYSMSPVSKTPRPPRPVGRRARAGARP